MLRHGEHEAELEAETRHEQLRLVARFPAKRQRIVSRQLGAESLADQPDLGRTDAVDRGEQKGQGHGCGEDQPCPRVEYHRQLLATVETAQSTTSRLRRGTR